MGSEQNWFPLFRRLWRGFDGYENVEAVNGFDFCFGAAVSKLAEERAMGAEPTYEERTEREHSSSQQTAEMRHRWDLSWSL